MTHETDNNRIKPEIAHSAAYERFVRYAIKDALELFEAKFPLVENQRNGTKIFENEIITKENGIYNILYLPHDEQRTDKHEQVKISTDKDKLTIVLKNDGLNSEVTMETIELNDSEPKRKLSSSINTMDSVYWASKILSQLSGLKNYDLLYSPADSQQTI